MIVVFFAELAPEDQTNIEENAEVILADGSIIRDVAYSAKKLKWAACTWAGKTVPSGIKLLNVLTSRKYLSNYINL